VVAGADVELLLLDAWGELSVAAARVSPIDRDQIVEAMAAATARAGAPPWCVAAGEWWRLQRAVATGDPAAAAAAADRLGAVARLDPRFATRAAAALAWAATLGPADGIDPAAVIAAADALAAAGQPGDAASMCGAAARRLADRPDDQPAVRELLGACRAFRARIASGERPSADRPDADGLSERERAVGLLLLDGLTHKQIGARLYISPKTVEQHVARLRQKLVASNRSELIAALRGRIAAGHRPATAR
jgi:DNA-binding CsgD family transcriptional regulator